MVFFIKKKKYLLNVVILFKTVFNLELVFLFKIDKNKLFFKKQGKNSENLKKKFKKPFATLLIF